MATSPGLGLQAKPFGHVHVGTRVPQTQPRSPNSGQALTLAGPARNKLSPAPLTAGVFLFASPSLLLAMMAPRWQGPDVTSKTSKANPTCPETLGREHLWASLYYRQLQPLPTLAHRHPFNFKLDKMKN